MRSARARGLPAPWYGARGKVSAVAMRILVTMWQSRDEPATDLYIALLIGCLHRAGYARFATSLILVGYLARAGDHIAKMRHPGEAYAKCTQSLWPDVIAQYLTDKTHDEHSMGNDSASTDRLTDFRIGMQGIEIARCTGVAHKLQVRDRFLGQGRNLIAHIDIFGIAVWMHATCHSLCSFRVTENWPESPLALARG